MRREYIKPSLTHVDLVPKEAVLAACKTTIIGGSVYTPNTTGDCITVCDQCRDAGS